MTTATAEPMLPPVDERVVRAHAEQLSELAASYGITKLRYASPGRLVGHVSEDRDLFDVVDFEAAAVKLLGGELNLFSDRVLTKTNVSPDLVEARSL